MNEALIKAIEALAEIQKAAGKAYAYKTPLDEVIEENKYQSAHPDDNDDADDGIPIGRAIKDRKKMLNVLRTFYRAYHHTYEGMDDFITLFGVYCNDYIRWNLHKALPQERDFGISTLFDEISDKNLQQYLLMLLQGIYAGIYDGTNTFFEAANREAYSLPNLYVFLRLAMEYGDETDPEREQHLETCMIKGLSSMNRGLREYCLGMSPALKPNAQIDENPLPYAIFGDSDEQFKASLAEKFYMNFKMLLDVGDHADSIDMENISKPDSYRIETAQHSIRECMAEMEWMENPNDDEETDEDTPISWADFRDDSGRMQRLTFLHIPCRVDWGRKSFSKLMLAISERNRAMREKEIAQKNKNKIVQRFTHTYKNLKATNLYHIATTLLARHDKEDQKLGQTLLLEYSHKKSMTKDVYMMQLCYEHNTKHLRALLQDSCLEPTKVASSSEANRIENLVEQALVTCLVNIFYDKNQKDLRNAFCLAFPKSALREIRNAFDQEVMQEKLSARDLLAAHGMEVSLTVAPEWQALAFRPDEYAAIFLKDILVELLVNAIKYGNLHQPIHLSFQSADNALLVSAANALPEDGARRSGTRIGLSSIDDTLSVLWGDELLLPRPHHQVKKNGAQFHVLMELPHAAFCKEGRTA